LQNFYKIKVLQSLTTLKPSQNKVFLSRWHRDTDMTSDAEYFVLFNTFFYLYGLIIITSTGFSFTCSTFMFYKITKVYYILFHKIEHDHNVARLNNYDRENFSITQWDFCICVKLQYSCETSSEDLDVWLQPPDILTNNSEPCLEDAKGDGEAVEQVI